MLAKKKVVQVRHAYKKANIAIDWLANMGLKTLLGEASINAPHFSLLPILFYDFNGSICLFINCTYFNFVYQTIKAWIQI
jgi:hypothetical protein